MYCIRKQVGYKSMYKSLPCYPDNPLPPWANHSVSSKSQPRTRHTREPDPTHSELKHTTTRKPATHERTPDKPHVHTHTLTHLPCSRAPERRPKPTDTAPHDSHTHSATPTRERARQWNHRLRELHRLLRERLRCLRASPGPAAPAQPRQALSLESGYMRIGYKSRYKSLPCPLG